MLVVATYRDTEAGPALRTAVADLRRRSSTEVITLRPWDDAAVAALLPPGCTRPWRRCCAARPPGCRCWSPPCWRTSSTTTGRRGSPRGRGVAARRARHASSTSPPNGWPGWLRPPGEPSRSQRSRARAADRRTSAGSTGPPGSAAVTRWRTASRQGCWCAPPRSTRLRPPHALLRDTVYAQVPAVTPGPWHAELAARSRRATCPASRDPGCARRPTRLLCRRRHRVQTAATRPPGPRVRPGRRAAGRGPGLPGVDRETRADLELDAAAAEFAAGRAEAAVRRCRAVAAAGATADQLVQAALTVRGLGGPLNASS